MACNRGSLLSSRARCHFDFSVAASRFAKQSRTKDHNLGDSRGGYRQRLVKAIKISILPAKEITENPGSTYHCPYVYLPFINSERDNFFFELRNHTEGPYVLTEACIYVAFVSLGHYEDRSFC